MYVGAEMSGRVPFAPVPDILCFHGGSGRAKLLESICRHLQFSDDPVVVVGEPGSGKTMMSLLLGNTLSRKYNIIHEHEPRLQPGEVVEHLKYSFRMLQPQLLTGEESVDEPRPVAPRTGLKRLQASIGSLSGDSRQTLLLLDCAQRYHARDIAFLQDLTQLNFNGIRAVKLVLFCTDPVLLTHKAPNSLMEFAAQKLFVRYTLNPLTMDETHDYLHHQMLMYDYHQRYAFSRDMSCLIAEKSAGNLRRINELARNTLRFSRQHGVPASIDSLLQADASVAAEVPACRSPVSGRCLLAILAGLALVFGGVFSILL